MSINITEILPRPQLTHDDTQIIAGINAMSAIWLVSIVILVIIDDVYFWLNIAARPAFVNEQINYTALQYSL